MIGENYPPQKNVNKSSGVKSDEVRNVDKDEDASNYSFSEFFGDALTNSTAIDNLNKSNEVAEFIPLENSNNTSIKQQKELKVNKCSKMILSKEHATLLMSQKGIDFIKNVSSRFDVNAQFLWDSRGNSLIIEGPSENHELFRNETSKFMFDHKIIEYERTVEKSTKVPKIKSTIYKCVKSNLQSIKYLSKRELKGILEKLNVAEKAQDHKKIIKYRRILNIAFMGFARLKNGKNHLIELRKILELLEKEIKEGHGNVEATEDFRNQVAVHLKYIFSAHNHGDYRKIFEDFKKVNLKRLNNQIEQSQKQ
jgi:hypothetical protein